MGISGDSRVWFIEQRRVPRGGVKESPRGRLDFVRERLARGSADAYLVAGCLAITRSLILLYVACGITFFFTRSVFA